MPIIEVMGIVLATCGVPVLLLQQIGQSRLARAWAGEDAGRPED